MSQLAGAYYDVGFQLRPLTVVQISNREQEALIGETTSIVQSMEDFVFKVDAERLRGIWIKSILEKERIPFRDLSDDASPEERVLKAAAVASDKIDLALEHHRVARMDMAIPSRFSVDLHPTDPILRMETLESLIPFQRIREIFIQREQNMSQEPIGQISFTATRNETGGPKNKMN